MVNRGVPGALRATTEADPPMACMCPCHLEAPFGHPMLEAFPPLIRARAGGIPRSFEPVASRAPGGARHPRAGRRRRRQPSLRGARRPGAAGPHHGRPLVDGPGLVPDARRPGAARAAGRGNAAGSDGHLSREGAGAVSPADAGPRHAVRRRQPFGPRSPGARAPCGRAPSSGRDRPGSEYCGGHRIQHPSGPLARLSRELGVTPADHWRATHRMPFPRRKKESTLPRRDRSSAGCSSDGRLRLLLGRFGGQPLHQGKQAKEMIAPATATAPSQP